jgi:hypothetical protein
MTEGVMFFSRDPINHPLSVGQMLLLSQPQLGPITVRSIPTNLHVPCKKGTERMNGRGTVTTFSCGAYFNVISL